MTRNMISSNSGVFLFILSCCFFLQNFPNTFASPARHSCHHDQKAALLELKNEFQIRKPESVESHGVGELAFTCYPKTKSWKNSSDCCSWDGVTCEAESGVVIGLDLSFSCLYGPLKPNSSLFRLQHLRSLNLTHNNFSSSAIPAEFSKFSRLMRLDLSHSVFSGRIPNELLKLTKLVSLDLSSSLVYRDLFIEKPFLTKLSRNLTNLRNLHLNYVNISSTVPKNFANLSSLRSLGLVDCGLFGEFSRDIFLLPQIKSISLSDNPQLTFFLSEFHINKSSLEVLDLDFTPFLGNLVDVVRNFKLLKVLDLNGCNLFGTIPSSLGNLSHLTDLRLSVNNLVGEVPSSIGNLNHLTILELSWNYLVGEVPSSVGNLNRLTELDLWSNKLSGNFPPGLLNLTELSSIVLLANQFGGPLPSNMSSLSKLEYFAAGRNSFVGAFPLSLLMIPSLDYVSLTENQLSGPLEFGDVSSSSKLRYLYIPGNNFSGSILMSSISKLVNLKWLDLSHIKILDLPGNNVSVANVNSTYHFPLHLEALFLSGCSISEFPEFLRTLRELAFLDLSNSRIKGQVPVWFWRLPELTSVNLSHNSFIGFEGSSEVIRTTRIQTLDLRSNAFEGPFPIPPPSVVYLFGSDNNFTGKLPRSMCKLNFLDILDLSNNRFSGLIPRCLGNFSNSLSVLNLRNNNLRGTLPRGFTTSCKLRTLEVGHNRLVGNLPKSVINCTSLEVLNVESNRINDTFPFWLETLPELQVLILRSNEFHGPMYHPRASLGFPKLRIIDISRNDLIGTLPSDYFANWTAMSSIKTNEDRFELKYMGDGYYQDSLVLMDKGVEMWFERILKIYTAIDFAGNRFQGQIPESIGLLKELKLLNLSNNAFIGQIPASLATLTELESLDLSQNRLSGKIPPELGSLSSLARINFSQNQLTGPIPQGTQFQTQNSSSFEGNLGLCGLPLEKSCGDANTPTSQQTEQLESEEEVVSWRAVAIGSAPGLVFGLTIGHIVTSYKRGWFMKTLGRNRCRRARTR